MATVRNYHHAATMRPYSLYHHPSQSNGSSQLDGSTATSQGSSIVGVDSEGSKAAVATVPYFYPPAKHKTASNSSSGNTGEKSNKKTWSQRLKLNGGRSSTKNDKSKSEKSVAIPPPPICHSGPPVARGYPDPWLYGTVRRGIPTAIPMQHHPIFYGQSQIPGPPEVAVIVCSCPEYLAGTTKKEVKKASVCKKCKGSRLPLASVAGGTIRLAPTASSYLPRGPAGGVAPMIIHSQRPNRHGQSGLIQNATVAARRQSRPTILGEADPYDLMRRSRLEATFGQCRNSDLRGIPEKSGRSRAKSSSPTRNRQSALPTSSSQNVLKSTSSPFDSIEDRQKQRSCSMMRLTTVEDFQEQNDNEDLWIDCVEQPAHHKTSTKNGMHSILQRSSHLNPYDLVTVGRQLHGSEGHKKSQDQNSRQQSRECDSMASPLDTQNLDGESEQFIIHQRSKTELENGHEKMKKQNQLSGQSFQETTPQSNRRSVAPVVASTSDANKSTTATPSKCGVSTEASPLRPPRKFGTVNGLRMIRPLLSPSSISQSSSSSSMKSNPAAVKSILKKYENVTFPTESPRERESYHSREEAGGWQNTPHTCKFSENLGSGESQEESLSKYDSNDKPKAKSSCNSEEFQEDCPLPNVSSFLRKRVQFCENNDTFSDQVRNVKDNELEANFRMQNVQESSGIARESEVITRTHTPRSCDSDSTNESNYSLMDMKTNENNQNLVLTRRGHHHLSESSAIRAYENSVPINEQPNEIRITAGDNTRTNIRRTLSDRRLRENSPEIFENNGFFDTMALRTKYRRDAREVDFINQIGRPKEPPPPPPMKKSFEAKRTSSNNYEPYSEMSSEISCSEESSSYELMSFQYSRQQAGVVAQKSTPVTKTANINEDKVPALSAVHRLEIRSSDDDGPPKKTSIIISGNDCYSTVNVNNETPLYQSSVVVNDNSSFAHISTTQAPLASTIHVNNTVTINLGAGQESSTIRKCSTGGENLYNKGLPKSNKSIIPIVATEVGKSANETNGKRSTCEFPSSPSNGKTLISLDWDGASHANDDNQIEPPQPSEESREQQNRHEKLTKLLSDPVEAIRLNLIPHVCGKSSHGPANAPEFAEITTVGEVPPLPSNFEDDIAVQLRDKKQSQLSSCAKSFDALSRKLERRSFISKLLEDPTLGHLAEGLDNDIIAKLIESSLRRLKENLTSNREINPLTLNSDQEKELSVNIAKLIDVSLQKLQDERNQPVQRMSSDVADKDQLLLSNNCNNDLGSICSGTSLSSANYEMFDFDNNPDSDCYQSCSSELTAEDESNSARSKFYQMLVDATLSEIEISAGLDDDHHYESIRMGNCDPIYEEICEIPPPLPLSLPPVEKKAQSRSRLFEGASKYDILSYLVDAKERGVVPEESYPFGYNFNIGEIIVEEENEDERCTDMSMCKRHIRQDSDLASRISDGSDEILASGPNKDQLMIRKSSSDIERNDSGVGSETSKTSRNKFLNGCVLDKSSPIHLCEDCDGPVETQITDTGIMYAPLVCRKCSKKRAERKEIITEIVETEEKYGRDLQIILEEFYQPMLVAGLLTQDQLSAIFLNTEELLENNQALAERMRDAFDIASEQGDDDFLTVNIGKIFLDSTQMLHTFETYCVGQAGASLLLANLEKEKELLRIFLRVSQMENSVLRRMNLNSFLMVPVQRVTKYPLLLARLYKVTPPQVDARVALKQAQEKIELHLNHMNQEAKDIPTKLWRRISSSSPGRRSSCELDMINIKLRKMAIDVLEWNHDEVRFAMEGKLLVTQPTDNNWRKGRTIKLAPINALLVTNGKPSVNYRADRAANEPLNFPRHTGIREASLLLVREKSGRYTLLRDPLYLDRCVICSEAEWADYFEVQEISSKDTFIFKAEDENRTKQWCAQLQYHSQGMGSWRKRRNALANIMINGMMVRS